LFSTTLFPLAMTNIETFTTTMLRHVRGVCKSQRNFFRTQICLILMMPHRCNYLGFERYGEFNELTYRNHYNRDDFDFSKFNLNLILDNTSNNRILAFDPSYIKKSGKHTPGVGYFWSGSASKVKWGMEIAGLAVVDLEANTALHYVVKQTQLKEGQSLMEFYTQTITAQSTNLLKISRYLAVDAFFAKKNFINPLKDVGQYVVTRFRNDAVMYYTPELDVPGKRGPKAKKGTRIDVMKIDTNKLKCLSKDNNQIVYGGLVFMKSLGYLVMTNIVHHLDVDGSVKDAKIYICTDVKVEASQVYVMYKSRFQIEFLYRDSKQFTGLEDSQSRNVNALEYHFNMSLTATSIAKAACHLSIPKEERGPFSLSSITTELHNRDMVKRIFALFAENPDINIIDEKVQKLYQLGKIAC
jgi:hypothetical protein